MHVSAESQSLAMYVPRCTECNADVQGFTLDLQGKSVSRPCGHKASVKLVPNPRLVRP